MTSKQHEALAAAFKSFLHQTYSSVAKERRKGVIWGQWEPIMSRVCIVLRHDNPGFDEKRFLKECGVA